MPTQRGSMVPGRPGTSPGFGLDFGENDATEAVGVGEGLLDARAGVDAEVLFVREGVNHGGFAPLFEGEEVADEPGGGVREGVALVRTFLAHDGGGDDHAEGVEGDRAPVQVGVGELGGGEDTVVVDGADDVAERIARARDEQREVVVGDEGVSIERIDGLLERKLEALFFEPGAGLPP